MEAFDRAILNEFLAEASELLDALEDSLLTLERNAHNGDALETALRSLHTIKGNASFFGLDAIVTLAHAAESTLESARDGGSPLQTESIDAVFEAGELLKGNVARIRRGEPMMSPDAALLHRLLCPTEATNPPEGVSDHSSPALGNVAETSKPAHRRALLGAALTDLRDSIRNVERLAAEPAADPAASSNIAHEINSICEGMERTARFFALADLESSISEMRRCAGLLKHAPGVNSESWAPEMLRHLANAFREIELIDSAGMDTPQLAGASQSTAVQCDERGDQISIDANQARPGNELRSVRVDVDRLESLLDLVGELVLRKNSVARLVQPSGPLAAAPGDLREIVLRLAEDLDRLTSDLQHATMRVRMQPLRLLFARFPRLIRDLARDAGKDVDLEIEGADTEVDRAVIEGLGESLAHLLRNSLDHGIEPPADRERAGKPRIGVIRVSAFTSGDHAVIRIADDGRGIDQARLVEKAIERRVVDADDVSAMSEREIHQLIFAPGFSTAERVSNLSGRGVGMDVVRRSVERLGGSIEVQATPGQGATVTLRVPLTISIIGALTVAVGPERYAIPLAQVVEARRVRTTPVVDDAPRISLRDVLDAPASPGAQSDNFAVVVEQHGQRAALLVSELCGRTDIVTKPLARSWAGSAPFGAATIDADGRVMLVLDVARVLERASMVTATASEAREDTP